MQGLKARCVVVVHFGAEKLCDRGPYVALCNSCDVESRLNSPSVLLEGILLRSRDFANYCVWSHFLPGFC